MPNTKDHIFLTNFIMHTKNILNNLNDIVKKKEAEHRIKFLDETLEFSFNLEV